MDHKARDNKDDLFSYYKQTLLVLINLVLFLKELMGDYRVATNHLSMQFKMLFRDRALSYSWLLFVLLGHLLIENCLKTYLERFYDPFLHKTISFKIFLLGKGFQMF